MPSITTSTTFLEDPFEHYTRLSLLTHSCKGFLSDPPNTEEDLDQLLRQEALKNAAKDTEQANEILSSISNLDTTGIFVDTAVLCKPKCEKSENMEEMTQETAMFKGNIDPSEDFPNPRIRRDGTGRVSTRRPFTIKSSSFGSNLNVQKDPRTLHDVNEFFAAAERQETAEAILRKMRGEKSPVAFCSQQSLKMRIRRQGSGRRTVSKNFDVKLLGSTEKYVQLDEEKLEEEEEEGPLSTFASGTGEACEMLSKLGHEELKHGEHLSETVNGDLQYQRDVRVESNWQNLMQAHDQHSTAHGGDINDHQVNPLQGKGTLCGSEIEETVNMPPKNLFSFENSTINAFNQLLKNYMNVDTENTNQVLSSRSGLRLCDIGKPHAKDLDCDKQNALPQSQTESSNTVLSQSLCIDRVKTITQSHQLPKNFHLPGSARTPFDRFCKNATETCKPLTSPTPPSKISAAFKSQRKRKSGVEFKPGDVCGPPIQNMDVDAAQDHTLSTSPIYRTHCLSNNLKQGQSSGVRRLSFDTPNSPKQDDVNCGEDHNNARAIDLVNPSKSCDENKKVEMVRTDVELSNVTVLSTQNSTPLKISEPSNSIARVSEKDILVSASGRQIEESPLTLHKRNAKKLKRKSKNQANTSGCDAHEEDKIISKDIQSSQKKNSKSDYRRRQSLAGAGTFWKSGVRRSTRIRSRPLEYWRGERFLYGRIHNTLTTVIGIKYSSPVPAQEKKHDGHKFKVKSYVDDQYSHLVEFAALH